jgi:hypothetical protein
MNSFPTRKTETAESTAPKPTPKAIWEGIRTFHEAEQNEDRFTMTWTLEHLEFLMTLQELSAAPERIEP